jgi:uncharacterized membrane-anchored protein YjiN (DUF445 family)
MGVVFAGTFFVAEPGFAVMLVRSGAEAGVVGGLADWFAVTALFHKPLGLPIPHTAIIPNSKERIGHALSRFVEDNFLTREVLMRKLSDADIARRFAAWLAQPRITALVAGWIAGGVPAFVRSIENDGVQDFIRRAMGDRLQKADLAPAVARLLRTFTASEGADAVLDAALDVALRWLDQSQAQIEELVHEHSRWWVPRTFNRRIAKAVIDGLRDVLEELRQPESEVRLKFRKDVANLIDEMVTSSAKRAQINEAIRHMLETMEVQAWLASVWTGLSQSAVQDVEKPGSRIRGGLERAVGSFAKGLAADPVMLSHIDNGVRHIALAVVRRRREIGGAIADVVGSWNARTVSDRLELLVGSDLQYIRMNGTIVGAGVGCLLYTATAFLGLV